MQIPGRFFEAEFQAPFYNYTPYSRNNNWQHELWQNLRFSSVTDRVTSSPILWNQLWDESQPMSVIEKTTDYRSMPINFDATFIWDSK